MNAARPFLLAVALALGGAGCSDGSGETGAPNEQCDAGDCAPAFGDSLDGNLEGARECQQLIASTCGGAAGADTVCGRGPACEAARLLADYEPERCAEAALDEEAFPPCAESPCELLVAKVCPSTDDGSCEPTCGLARDLEADHLAADDAELRAEIARACQAGLEDSGLFPECPGRS